ncbi:WD40-repeat-containing domain protein [Podospora appendiculata]|uniref:WD40-repeat-containing domain protein n=1 Tax=Podospora appendiculata TaxID=314037 RepID=A0AAE0XM73_9PEZI|nr:WD40-repeat-containing domain protein [Podospora appendiculata]
MNTRPPIETPNPTLVLSITFNDDCSNFAVGLNSGFCIFHTESCSLRTTRDFNAGVGLVQLMGKANYVGLVGGGTQPKFAGNKLILWDDRNSKIALEISLLTPVRGVQLSKERIVVVLQNSVRVYKFAKPPNFISAYETANNVWGLCCLSPRRIAFPGRTSGHVQLVELATGNVSIIPAHSSALRAIALSRDGDLLATASEMPCSLIPLTNTTPSHKGTLIRIFATTSCARLVELRRGIDPATIFSLAFSPSGSKLACTSDKATLHIFDVPGGGDPQAAAAPAGPAEPPAPGTAGAVSKGATGAGKWGILSKIPLMPRMFSDVYSFASASFEAGEEPVVAGLPMSASTTLGTARPPKGVIGWVSEDKLVVIGGGTDARWELFGIAPGQGGEGRVCLREGWRRYLGEA